MKNLIYWIGLAAVAVSTLTGVLAPRLPAMAFRITLPTFSERK